MQTSVTMRRATLIHVWFWPCNKCSGLDRDFDSLAAVHLVERALVVLELEDIRDHALDVDFPAVEVRHGTREAECLRERADDLRSASK